MQLQQNKFYIELKYSVTSRCWNVPQEENGDGGAAKLLLNLFKWIDISRDPGNHFE